MIDTFFSSYNAYCQHLGSYLIGTKLKDHIAQLFQVLVQIHRIDIFEQNMNSDMNLESGQGYLRFTSR